MSDHRAVGITRRQPLKNELCSGHLAEFCQISCNMFFRCVMAGDDGRDGVASIR